MTKFSDEQLAALREKLDPAHVKTREQAGRTLSYVEAWHAIAEANRIFGFDAWDRETVELRAICERETKIGQPPRQRDGWRVGYVAKVRVRVRTGDVPAIIREGCGYGSGIDADLGAAHESALKEAESDAMKRALMTFGNPFGLALYDKEHRQVAEPAPPPKPEPAKRRSEHPQRQEALDAYHRITEALEKANSLKLVNDIMEINKAHLALIDKVHADTGKQLRALAEGRRQEFRSAA